MNDYKRVMYFTYQDLLNEVSIEDVDMPRFPHDMQMSSNWFTSLIEVGELEFAVYTLSEFFTNDLINDIVNALMGVVYNRHANDYIACVEYDNGYSMEEAMMQALSKLIGVIDLTLPRYIPLLQQNEWASTCPITPNVDETTESSSGENHNEYDGETSSNSSGQTRNNDTPQNSGNFDDDEHTSSLTDSTDESSGNSSGSNDGDFTTSTTRSSSTNIGTLMSRLDEMYKGFRSIILEWSNEFNQLFLKEEQL